MEVDNDSDHEPDAKAEETMTPMKRKKKSTKKKNGVTAQRRLAQKALMDEARWMKIWAVDGLSDDVLEQHITEHIVWHCPRLWKESKFGTMLFLSHKERNKDHPHCRIIPKFEMGRVVFVECAENEALRVAVE